MSQPQPSPASFPPDLHTPPHLSPSDPSPPTTPPKKNNKKRCGGKKIQEQKRRAAAAAAAAAGAEASTDQPLYNLLPSTTKNGLGLFAARNIPAGTRIISEEPLMTVPRGNGMGSLILRGFWGLSIEEMGEFMGLCMREEQEKVFDDEGGDDERGEDAGDEEEEYEENGMDMPELEDWGNGSDGSESSAARSDDEEQEERRIVDRSVDRVAAFLAELGLDKPDSKAAVHDVADSHGNSGEVDPEDIVETETGVEEEHRRVRSSSHHHRIDSTQEATSLASNPHKNNAHLEDEPTSASTTASSNLGHQDLSSPDQENDPTSPVEETIYYAKDIINVFETNALGCEIGDTIIAVLCLTASRINHSCVPNAFCSYDSRARTHVVHAIRDIAAGEELFNSYIIGSFKTTAERRRELKKWGFRCTCPACEGTWLGGGSDERRKKLGELYVSAEKAKVLFMKKQLSPDLAADAVQVLAKMVNLMEQEGLRNPDLADLCGAAGFCSESPEDTFMWFARKLAVMLCCYGRESPCYQRNVAAFRQMFVGGGGQLADLPEWLRM